MTTQPVRFPNVCDNLRSLERDLMYHLEALTSVRVIVAVLATLVKVGDVSIVRTFQDRFNCWRQNTVDMVGLRQEPEPTPGLRPHEGRICIYEIAVVVHGLSDASGLRRK